MTNPRRITAAMIDAARARTAVVLAGGNPCPPPKAAKRSTRFMPRVTPRPCELAVRSKTGVRIGPR